MKLKVNTDYANNAIWDGWKNGHNEWVINLVRNNAPLDLTPYTFRLDIYRNSDTRGNPLLSLTQGEGLTNGTTAGTITNVLTETQAKTTLKGHDFYFVLSYTYNSKTYPLFRGPLTLGTGNNPGSTTTETTSTVTMAGEDGSYTSVTASVTLPGDVVGADFDVDSITPEQAQTIMAKLIDNMTDEQKDEFVAAIIDDIRTTINDA